RPSSRSRATGSTWTARRSSWIEYSSTAVASRTSGRTGPTGRRSGSRATTLGATSRWRRRRSRRMTRRRSTDTSSAPRPGPRSPTERRPDVASPGHVVVVGGGVFGAASALELRSRGWAVTLLDPHLLPYEGASSTDVSKLVRMDYGSDAYYHELAEAALEGWDRWNAESGRPL